MAEVIANSACVDCKQLCVATDKVAWVLYCDLVCLDYDGSVLDACVASLFAALKTGKIYVKNNFEKSFI
jgi:exosome complex component RRP43